MKKISSNQLSLDFLFGGVSVFENSKNRIESQNVQDTPQEPLTSESVQEPQEPEEAKTEGLVEIEEEIPRLTETDTMKGCFYLEMLCTEKELMIFLWGKNPDFCLVRSHSSKETQTSMWVLRKRALEILEEYGYRRSSLQFCGNRQAVVFVRK